MCALEPGPSSGARRWPALAPVSSRRSPGLADLAKLHRVRPYNSLPRSLRGMFSLPSSSFSCDRVCRTPLLSWAPRRSALTLSLPVCLPPRNPPGCFQFGIHTSCRSDQSRLLDGSNEDLRAQSPGPPQTEINPASVQTGGLQPGIQIPSSRLAWEAPGEPPSGRQRGPPSFSTGRQEETVSQRPRRGSHNTTAPER